jgi:hypothetical protein
MTGLAHHSRFPLCFWLPPILPKNQIDTAQKGNSSRLACTRALGRLPCGFGDPLNDPRSDLPRGWQNRWWLKDGQVGLDRERIPQEQFAEAKPGTELPQNISAQLPFHTLLG